MLSADPSASPVLIVGAGLAGLCLAQSLVQRGIDVQIFERDAGDRPRRQGYRITLDRHGVAALKYCLPADLFALVMATKGIPGGSFRYTDRNLRDIFALKFDMKPEDGGQVDRQTLHTILRMGLEDRIRFGKSALAVEDTAEGTLLRFSDGTAARGSIVVAADGAGSALRSQIATGADPVPSSFLGLYGASRLIQDGSSIVPAPLAKSGVLALNDRPGHAFFFTAMRFPEPPVDAFARYAPNAHAPVSESYAMWGLVFPTAELPGDIRQSDAASMQSLAGGLAERYHPALRAMVATSNPEYTLLARFAVARRPASWKLLHATLMGDAVHVMPPFGAHGGNTALRDAALLAEKLKDAADAGRASESAFASYQQEMEEYAFKAVASADRSMQQLEMNPVLRWLMLNVVTRFHRPTVPTPRQK